jgi:hypothetical protein
MNRIFTVALTRRRRSEDEKLRRNGQGFVKWPRWPVHHPDEVQFRSSSQSDIFTRILSRQTKRRYVGARLIVSENATDRSSKLQGRLSVMRYK